MVHGKSILLGVEINFTAYPSHSKPCLRVPQHTAPDVDTLLSAGTGLQPPAL
ncbi:hypothetical protein NIES46_50110 [Arthrospira platensis NIES-46]|uniref:Uncharacterized protein n=1 Tax=Limnospira platensis NIES-46 TaxID=1236695 RepID=A0A5M3TG09_LIMPL|nr:hypothetical protein NIES46_50110 [Arthrospira platensis NIES-46]